MALPEEELACPICLETVVKAIVCTRCYQHFCGGHIDQLDKCPTCRADPLRAAPNPALQKLVDRVRVKCRFCEVETPRGELEVHERNCQQDDESMWHLDRLFAGIESVFKI